MNITQLYCFNEISLFLALPSPPQNVRVTPLSSAPTSLQVQWTQPENMNGVFYRYTVRCGTQESYSDSKKLIPTFTMTGLNVLTTYTCCVSVNNHANESEAECGTGTTVLGQLITD